MLRPLRFACDAPPALPACWPPCPAGAQAGGRWGSAAQRGGKGGRQPGRRGHPSLAEATALCLCCPACPACLLATVPGRVASKQPALSNVVYALRLACPAPGAQAEAEKHKKSANNVWNSVLQICNKGKLPLAQWREAQAAKERRLVQLEERAKAEEGQAEVGGRAAAGGKQAGLLGRLAGCGLQGRGFVGAAQGGRQRCTLPPALVWS